MQTSQTNNIENLRTSTKDVEANSTSTLQSKKREKKYRKRKRKFTEKNENEDPQNNVEISLNIQRNLELRNSILPEVETNSELNTTDIEESNTSKNKKRQKISKKHLENELCNVVNIEQHENQELQDPKNEIEPCPEQVTAGIAENFSTSEKQVETYLASKNKKRSMKKRYLTRSMSKKLKDFESMDNIREKLEKLLELEESITQSETSGGKTCNQEMKSPIMDIKAKEVSDTSTINNETNMFATRKNKKRKITRNKKKKESKSLECSDDFLMHVTDLKSNQSNDSIFMNETITSMDNSKTNITIPQTLIPDVYEREKINRKYIIDQSQSIKLYSLVLTNLRWLRKVNRK